MAPRAAAKSGIAPALVLDIQTLAGLQYYLADRPLVNFPTALVLPGAAQQLVTYLPWLLGAGSLNFYRSLQTDTLTLFIFRYYAVDMGCAWIEQHGLLSVGDTNRSTVQLPCSQLLQGQDDTPVWQVSENCQLIWAEPRCGATGSTECLYTFASCQVPEHFVGIQTAFETNNPSTVANLPTTTFNRKRSW